MSYNSSKLSEGYLGDSYSVSKGILGVKTIAHIASLETGKNSGIQRSTPVHFYSMKFRLEIP